MAEEAAKTRFYAGNEAFVDEDFDLAIKCYTEALDIGGENADYYLKRCNAFIKKENFHDAIKDVDLSIKLNDKDSRSHQRKGYALFNLKDYSESLQSYKRALDIDNSNDKIKQWIRKCEAEIDLAEKKINNKKSAVGLSKLHKPEPKIEDISKPVLEKPVNGHVINEAVRTSKVKYDWYQTETHVVITVLVKKLKKEDVTTEFTDETLSITAKLPSGSDYSLELDLAHPIIPKESLSRVLSTKIEIKIKKKEGIRWSSLETDNESQFVNTNIQKENNTTENSVHKYPTSRHLYTDWDRLAKDVQEEEKKEESEGDSAINTLFQQIYADGSDEVKKAMNKSFQESGGTVLSTNWSEIKKDTVEVKPPDCMEYKKYEY